MEKKNEKANKIESELIRDVNEDTDQVKKFIIILVCVSLIAGLLYFVSSKFVIKDGVSDNDVVQEETIAYGNVDVGNIFNRPYDEYYVLAYDPDSLQAPLYASYLTTFDKKDSKMYFLDLSSDINKKYVGDGNASASNASEISLKEPTLIKIKNGKIEKYFETVEDIAKELK